MSPNRLINNTWISFHTVVDLFYFFLSFFFALLKLYIALISLIFLHQNSVTWTNCSCKKVFTRILYNFVDTVSNCISSWFHFIFLNDFESFIFKRLFFLLEYVKSNQLMKKKKPSFEYENRSRETPSVVCNASSLSDEQRRKRHISYHR